MLEKLRDIYYARKMIGFILRTLLGLFSSSGGFYTAYIYIKGEEQGSTPLLLIPAVLLIGVGVFLLLRASKGSITGITQPKQQLQELPDASHESFADVLKRNNEIAKKWESTGQLKDQLKVLQASAEATDEDTTG